MILIIKNKNLEDFCVKIDKKCIKLTPTKLVPKLLDNSLCRSIKNKILKFIKVKIRVHYNNNNTMRQ